MEEAPQGTFQDELDWCIQQLETGLLRRNPTPQQAQDTEKILKVLHSRKSPHVKKRQVMNQVFGNYRLKMTEERRQKENAAKPSPKVQIEEVTHPDSRSVAYRKCPRDGQGTSSAHWFTPSDSSFSFNFCTEQTEGLEGAGPENTEDGDAKCEQLEISSIGSMLSSKEESGFSFNFQISEDAASSSQNCEGQESMANTSSGQPSAIHSLSEVRNVAESQEASSQNVATSEEACSTSGLSANQNLTLEAAVQNVTDSPKKKKKKTTQKKSHCAQAEKKPEEHKADTEKSPPASEDGQSGASELQRELDWCVEQLEIGLQRQKSAPKKVEEAMRAVRTLRGEKVALVKKRQLMRTMFGDYRRKMEEERQKQLKLMQAAAKSARVIEVSETARRKSSKVFRKSARQSHSDNGQDLPADSQDPPTQAAPDQGGFIFQSSQEPFRFNFL
ncbi:PREDICTED: UPF0488 protein C8orf33 homolog [Nanorana parkeri]|uniref:UPF0488 protein C8orf33 homolog n=1 Tax=Nanorana parkeri TaxID=125878 RepID=UPI000854C6B8|nr:PREDICTED: UPF0488 protein C8orf33 homolog [Nanorana parkeri]